jgi:hypothetical protein
MGACDFRISYRGKSLHDAYDSAVEDAIEEYGNDAYNGTISTTIGVIDFTNEYKKSGKSLDAFISNTISKMTKRACGGICIEELKTNTNKVKSKVVHHVEKGTKKWVLKYVIKEGSTLGNVLRGFPTKGEAVNYAREYTEKNQIMTVVEMQKVLEKGDTKVAVVMYKKSSDERLGKWILFGIAAE